MSATTAPRIDVRWRTDERGAIAYLTLDNRKKLNTLDRALMSEFIATVGSFAEHPDLRAVVLSGAGEKAFVGGANIPEMAALDRQSARAYITLVHQTCDCLRQLPVPVVARIDGYALGAGLELAASCDLRVASTRALFGMPEVKVGIPSVVEAALLPRLIGFGRARELVLLGEIIDAPTALAWGLVERAVPPNELDDEIEKVVTALLSAGPRAVRLQKELIRQWEILPADRAIAAGIDSFVRAFESDEPRRMLSSFVRRVRS